MRLTGNDCHLTYCTNIHPGERWERVRENLERHVLEVKRRVCPEAPFGVGLRLSAQAARQLADGAQLAWLKDFAQASGLYFFTINGFPHGTFHGQPVKEQVYLPDWRDEERLRYTNQLADLLAALLPAGVDGSISTVPCGFAPELAREQDVTRVVERLLAHAAHLHGLAENSGQVIALALEPEPACYLETIDETVRFFKERLWDERGVARFAALTGLDRARAADALRRHLGVCLDTCHAAVEFEDAATVLDSLAAAEIGIKKLQLSCGLRLPNADPPSRAALSAFVNDVYLHQVVRRGDDGLTRYTDLPPALDAALDGEWRVHFHVPIFLERLDAFDNTQAFLREILALHRQSPLSPQLEVETYTWQVLPEAYRKTSLDEAIARELSWVLDELRR